VVKEAADKQEGLHKGRTLIRRLSERQLSIDYLATELSKVHVFGDRKNVVTLLTQILISDSFSAAFLLAATKLDEDFKKGLIPNEFGDVTLLSKKFGCLFFEVIDVSDSSDVDLPPFTKQAVFAILQNFLSKNC
jgi:hypothetical protein